MWEGFVTPTPYPDFWLLIADSLFVGGISESRLLLIADG